MLSVVLKLSVCVDMKMLAIIGGGFKKKTNLIFPPYSLISHNISLDLADCNFTSTFYFNLLPYLINQI